MQEKGLKRYVDTIINIDCNIEGETSVTLIGENAIIEVNANGKDKCKFVERVIRSDDLILNYLEGANNSQNIVAYISWK